MIKLISPCASCTHHLFGLTKDCEKCEKCEKRLKYVEIMKNGIPTNDFDPWEEYPMDAKVRSSLPFFV